LADVRHTSTEIFFRCRPVSDQHVSILSSAKKAFYGLFRERNSVRKLAFQAGFSAVFKGLPPDPSGLLKPGTSRPSSTGLPKYRSFPSHSSTSLTLSLGSIVTGRGLGGAVFSMMMGMVTTLVSLFFLGASIAHPISFSASLSLSVPALSAWVAVSVQEVF